MNLLEFIATILLPGALAVMVYGDYGKRPKRERWGLAHGQWNLA